MTDPTDPFEQLRDDGRAGATPDPRFVARLRRQIEARIDNPPAVPPPSRSPTESRPT